MPQLIVDPLLSNDGEKHIFDLETQNEICVLYKEADGHKAVFNKVKNLTGFTAEEVSQLAALMKQLNEPKKENGQAGGVASANPVVTNVPNRRSGA